MAAGAPTFTNSNMMNDAKFGMLLDARYRSIYPSPYFDPIAMQMITDPRIMIQWSRFFYEWNPIVSAAIYNMSVYPITDFIFETDDQALKARYEDAFDQLDVRSHLVRANLDFNIAGGSFSSILNPFVKTVTCTNCGTTFRVEEANIKVTNWGMQLECRECNHVGVAELKEIKSRDVKDLHIIHWNPMYMTVEYDEILGTYEYFYDIADYVKEGLATSKRRFLATYPQYFFDAAKAGHALRLKPSEVLYIKREGYSCSFFSGWGQPLISASMKYLFHLLLLLRAQDAISMDQILPWSILSPTQGTSADPAGETDFAIIRNQIKTEWDKFKQNPTHKSVMPVPLRVDNIGGQAKALNVYPEMEEVNKNILAGMGVPMEFIFGGLQWSGASVSMRILENKLLNSRRLSQRLIDRIVDKLVQHLGLARIKVRLQPLKMADDVAQKELLINLATQGLISKHTLLSDLMPDVDFEVEQDRLLKEQLAAVKAQADLAKASETLPGGGQMNMPGMESTPGDQAQQEHGDLPEQKPPQAKGGKKQI